MMLTNEKRDHFLKFPGYFAVIVFAGVFLFNETLICAQLKAAKGIVEYVSLITSAEGEIFSAVEELIKGLEATKPEKDEYGIKGYIVGSGVYIAREYFNRAGGENHG